MGGQTDRFVDCGRVRVFAGAAPHLELFIIPGIGEPAITGRFTMDQLGFSVSYFGDLDGANPPEPELLAGAYLFDPSADVTFPGPAGCIECAVDPDHSGVNNGAAYIVDGNGQSGNLRYEMIGQGVRDHIGWMVSRFDIDADGLADVFTSGFAWDLRLSIESACVPILNEPPLLACEDPASGFQGPVRLSEPGRMYIVYGSTFNALASP